MGSAIASLENLLFCHLIDYQYFNTVKLLKEVFLLTILKVQSLLKKLLNIVSSIFYNFGLMYRNSLLVRGYYHAETHYSCSGKMWKFIGGNNLEFLFPLRLEFSKNTKCLFTQISMMHQSNSTILSFSWKETYT